MKKAHKTIRRKALRLFALLVMILVAMTPMAAFAAGNPFGLTVGQVFTTSSSTPADATFTYRLKAQEPDAPMPTGSTAEGYTFTITGNSSVTISLAATARQGVFHYRLAQIVDAPKPGYTYSKQTYTIEAYMEEAGTQLIVQDGKGAKTDQILFENSYNAPPNNPGGGGGGGGGNHDATPSEPSAPPASGHTNTPPAATPPQAPTEATVMPAPPAAQTPPVNPPTTIDQPPEPVTPPETGHVWSLTSLLMSAVAVLIAFLHFVFLPIQKRRFDDYRSELEKEGLLMKEADDEMNRNENIGRGLRVLSIIAGIATPVVWLYFDWPLKNMAWFNHWTPFVTIVFIICLALTVVYFIHKATERSDVISKTRNDGDSDGIRTIPENKLLQDNADA